MNVLAIETSGAAASAAACRDAEVLAEETLGEGAAHGRMLLPLIGRTVQAAGWDKRRDIGLLAVSIGPGSFTGLRVGVVCAKTLAVELDVPLAAVGSLRAMAENAPPEHDRVLCALDAKRGEVYAAAFARQAAGWRTVREPCLAKPAEAAGWLESPFLALGDGLGQHAETLAPPGCTAGPPEAWSVRASAVARIGLAEHHAGRAADPLLLEPLYLRLPDAEEKRLRRERGA